MKHKKILIFSGIILTMPLALTLSSCSLFDYDTNYITSCFYNSYDNLTALGIIPENQAKTSTLLQIDAYPYMDKFINKDKTKFSYFGDSTSEVNLKQLREFKTHTLVLNEWARVEQPSYLNGKVTKKIAYTSMADSEQARYSKEETRDTYTWLNYEDLQPHSYRNSLMMLAKDLDKYHTVDNETLNGAKLSYQTYEARANDIIKKDNELIKKIRKEVDAIELFKAKDNTGKSTGKKVKIGIFSEQKGGGAIVRSEKLTSMYDPFIYPMIYGPSSITYQQSNMNKNTIVNDGIGLGFDFPNIKDNVQPINPNKQKEYSNLKHHNGEIENSLNKTVPLNWAGKGGGLASISAKTPEILEQAFKDNKFDYIIYVASPEYESPNIADRVNINETRIKNSEKYKSLSKFLNGSKSQTENDKRIHIVNYIDWYPTTWGTIGSRHVLGEFIKSLNYFIENNTTSGTKKFITTLDIIEKESNNDSYWWDTFQPNELVKPQKK